MPALRLTVKSTTSLGDELLQNDFEFVLTGKLNQDCSEVRTAWFPIGPNSYILMLPFFFRDSSDLLELRVVVMKTLLLLLSFNSFEFFQCTAL